MAVLNNQKLGQWINSVELIQHGITPCVLERVMVNDNVKSFGMTNGVPVAVLHALAERWGIRGISEPAGSTSRALP